MTKSHILAANAPAWTNIPEGQLANESKIRLKCGRPIGSKDVTPWKRRTQMRIDTLKRYMKKKRALVEALDKQKALIEAFGEQEAFVEAYIEQKTPEDVRNKELALEETHVPKILRS